MDESTLDFSNLTARDTRRLNEIAERLKKPYTLFIDECCRKYGDNPLFWASPLVSRNIYNDGDTFLSMCRVSLATERIKNGHVSHITTVLESEKKILETLVGSKIQVDTQERKSFARSLKKKIKISFSFITFCLQELSYMRHAGKTRCPVYARPISVVITPVLSSCFNGQNYNDRYFSGITEFQNVIFFPSLINNDSASSKDFVDRVKNCDNYDFISPFSFLHSLDLFDILKYWKLINKIKKDTYIFGDINITPVIQRCLEEGKANTPAFKGILARKIIRRMSEKGLPVDNFIIWYEGRPSDVMVASAIREFFPGAGCVGFEGYPIPEVNLAEFISDYQYRTGHSPKIMAIPGKAYEPLAHCFCDDIQLIFIPIMRNEYVLRKSVRKAVTSRTILVVLSYFPDVSREILNGINRYMRNNNNISSRIKIKNHPVNMNYTVADYSAECDSYSPEFIYGSLNDSLRDADIVITSTTSSTLEILFSGIPLIIVYPNGKLGYTALPPKVCDDLYQIVYEDELSEAIEHWLTVSSPDNSVLCGMLVEKTPESVGQMFCGLTDND